MLQYCQLHHKIFMDTMFASTFSMCFYKCAQMFSSDFRWLCAYLMKTKGDSHNALCLMFQRESVQPLMVMDNLKEQTLGKF